MSIIQCNKKETHCKENKVNYTIYNRKGKYWKK